MGLAGVRGLSYRGVAHKIVSVIDTTPSSSDGDDSGDKCELVDHVEEGMGKACSTHGKAGVYTHSFQFVIHFHYLIRR